MDLFRLKSSTIGRGFLKCNNIPPDNTNIKINQHTLVKNLSHSVFFLEILFPPQYNKTIYLASYLIK